ncbi:hypothetical protein SUGI_0255020 [Cryptomeria japonica]|uniref:uncharacterized protein LOC131053981 n=1 Tax=Cryptomeria japonica TaxID=3369 RepID=UPI002408A078|nr:uncharacterized protein LOC131053981 [Cryptomeria japonica]GLJ15527.1 hypothetical protein SUGI_0255020 [Cryptomeria japonica]
MKTTITIAVLLLLGTLFMLLLYYGQDMNLFKSDNGVSSNKKLNVKIYDHSNNYYRRELSDINLSDYHLIDPVPNSGATVKSAPIEHDAPRNPWNGIITLPTPPPHDTNNHTP